MQPQEAVHDKTQDVEHKHGKNATIDALDDLKYQVMKRDKETSRVDGRVDSVILKRKAESPLPSPVETVGDNRKKMKLLTNCRRMSTPTASKEFLNVDNSKNVEKIPTDRQATITKANADESNRIDRKSSIKSRETPSRDVVMKTNIKEDLISAVVKKLDTLQAFVSTNDNSKIKNVDSVSQSSKITEHELCIESGSFNDIVDKSTVIPQRNESHKDPKPVVDPNKSKSDEDENLLVPMHDRPIHHELSDSKKDLQMTAIISSRQGSMSGSSIQSVTGSLDDPFEMSIKTEPMSGDEMDNSNDNSLERIVSPLDNRSHNGTQESSFSKITVKNINLMTKPLEQMQRSQVAVRRLQTNKSGKPFGDIISANDCKCCLPNSFTTRSIPTTRAKEFHLNEKTGPTKCNVVDYIQYSTTAATTEFSTKTIAEYGVHSNGSIKLSANRINKAGQFTWYDNCSCQM